MAAPAPQAWQYCCRLGTHDPRGNNARKNVAIEQLRKLYRSYLAHESQHGKAVKSHADVLALLETDLPEEELDEKVLEAEKLSKRAT